MIRLIARLAAGAALALAVHAALQAVTRHALTRCADGCDTDEEVWHA